MFPSDIDECTKSNGGCHANATCTNLVGRFNCSCHTGFEGDGASCTDVNECNGTNTCHEIANCTNNPGSYECRCRDGYTGSGQQCDDVDECKTGTHDCDKV